MTRASVAGPGGELTAWHRVHVKRDDATRRALESFDISDQLWRISVPTLVLAGTRDVIVPPDRQRALASSIPGARFASLEAAGHIGFLTHRAEIAQHVGQLLRDARHSLC